MINPHRGLPVRALVLMLIAATMVSPRQADAQRPATSSAPDTPAARQFLAWLTAFDGASRDSLKAFYEQHYPTGLGRLEQVLNFRESTGGFDLLKSVSSTPTHFVAWVQERGSDQFAEAAVDVDSAPPYHITGVRLNAIPRPAEF